MITASEHPPSEGRENSHGGHGHNHGEDDHGHGDDNDGHAYNDRDKSPGYAGHRVDQGWDSKNVSDSHGHSISAPAEGLATGGAVFPADPSCATGSGSSMPDDPACTGGSDAAEAMCEAEWAVPGVDVQTRIGHALLDQLEAITDQVVELGTGIERSLTLDGATARAMLVATHALHGRLEAVRLGLIRRSLADDPPSSSGTKPGKATKNTLIDECRRSPAHARSDASKAQLLDPDTGALPKLSAALAAGQISAEHVDVARRCLEHLPAWVKRDHASTLDELITDHACRFSPATTKHLTKVLLDIVDPDRADRGHPDAYTKRGLTFSWDMDGMLVFRGQLDASEGARFAALINHFADLTRHQERCSHRRGNAEHVTGSTSKQDDDESPAENTTCQADGAQSENTTRQATGAQSENTNQQADQAPAESESEPVNEILTMAQRRADALSWLLDLAEAHHGFVIDPDTGQPTTSGPGGALNLRPSRAVPHVTVILHAEDLADGPTNGHEPPDGDDPPSGHEPPNGDDDPYTTPWEAGKGIVPQRQSRSRHHQQMLAPEHSLIGPMLISGEPLTNRTLGILTCDAVLDRVWLTSTGRIQRLDTLGRLATAAQQAAVVARDRVCTFPDCMTPPALCHVHHVTWWRNGGPTDTGNLGLLCNRHHRLIHHQPPNGTGWIMRMQNGRPIFIPPAYIDPDRQPRRNSYPTALAATYAAAGRMRTS